MTLDEFLQQAAPYALLILGYVVSRLGQRKIREESKLALTEAKLEAEAATEKVTADMTALIMRELTNERVARQADRVDFSKRIEAAESRAAAAEKENEVLQAKIEALQTQAQDFTYRLKAMADKLAESEQNYMTEIGAVKAERDAIRTERDAIRTERDELRTQIERLEAERSADAEALEALSRLMNGVEIRLTENENKLSRFEAAIRVLEQLKNASLDAAGQGTDHAVAS